MAIIYADSSGDYDDGYIFENTLTSIPDTRNATSGTAIIQNNAGAPAYAQGIACGHGKIGFGDKIAIWRTVLSFDVSGESENVLSVNLKITSKSDNPSGVVTSIWNDETYVCKVTPVGSAWAATDFNSLDGWVDQESSWAGVATQYATAFTNTASTTHTIALNATAISHLNSFIGTSDRFHLMLLHSDDFEYIVGEDALGDPEATSIILTALDGGFFWDASAATTPTLRPQLDITYGDPPIGYSHDVAGVGSSNISTINGVATANISKIIGV